jgi:hypothetical protein
MAKDPMDQVRPLHVVLEVQAVEALLIQHPFMVDFMVEVVVV